MPYLAKIFLPQAEQRRAVEFSIAADIVVGVGMKFFAVFVVPDLFRLVLSLEVYRPRVPVVLFSGHIAAAFHKQNLFARCGKLIGERAAAGAAADDNDVIMVLACHFSYPQTAFFCR